MGPDCLARVTTSEMTQISSSDFVDFSQEPHTFIASVLLRPFVSELGNPQKMDLAIRGKTDTQSGIPLYVISPGSAILMLNIVVIGLRLNLIDRESCASKTLELSEA